ncbi:GGDEF domain-containing protein [Acidobacteria bacterium AB60]|nr:GGDEF domain-containing protein [Acidobacteria bacterium AB60]
MMFDAKRFPRLVIAIDAMAAGLRLRALFVAATLSAGYAVCLYAAEGPAVTSARAVHSMPPGEAAHHYPVHLRAVLTFYDPYVDPRRGVTFVCDRSGCVFVSVPKTVLLNSRVGDLIEVAGVTGPGDYASIVEATRVETVGHPGLPRARRVTMDDLESGVYDTDWIQVEGRVRSIHREANIVSLIIAAKGGSFGAVTLPEPGVDYDHLIDSLIRLTANTAPVFNQRRQMVAVHLFFPSIRQVEVLEPAPPDPFLAKPISVLNLFRFSPDSSMVHRVHIQGAVTLDWPARMLCIKDQDSSLCMQAAQASPVPLGSRVDVVGFPAIRFFKPTLEYPSFRLADAPGPPVQPVPVTADRILHDDLDGKLVSFEAELVGRNSASPDPTLLMQAGGSLVSVLLPREIPASVSRQWKDGSILRIAGICNAEINSFSIGIGDGIVRPESINILLRSAGDITVVRAPSWWTPQRTWGAFGAIGLLVAICLAWIGILRHLIKSRTRELRASRERLRYLSEHDALTNLPNRILLHDRLTTAFHRARRFKTRVGVLMADLDGFKEINDLLGHHAGDQVLSAVAARLSGSVRSTDTVARTGGDEFVILLADIRDDQEAASVAAKLVAALAEPLIIDGQAIRVTISIGVATFPEDGNVEENLMRLADQAMYRAKQLGKNRVELHSPHATSSPRET